MSRIAIGDTFTNLTVTGFSERNRYITCRCICGVQKDVRRDHLLTGATTSCGCRHRELSKARVHRVHAAARKHGLCKSRIYSIWHAMKQRCENQNLKAYPYYGARGIYVCERWKTFENFLADMGQPPDCMTLDRIDNDGPYSPANCRWATRREQQTNLRSNIWLTAKGETKTITEWSRQLGLGHSTIADRLMRGLSVEEALIPEKLLDLSGLSLGGRANGDRQMARTHCKNGHPFDEVNTFHNGRQRVCRACRRERAARDRRR